MHSEFRVPEEKELDLEQQKAEMGAVGKFLGRGDTARTNLTAIVVVPLVAAGILISFFNSDFSGDFWKTVLPVITLGLGYIWGQHMDSE